MIIYSPYTLYHCIISSSPWWRTSEHSNTILNL